MNLTYFFGPVVQLNTVPAAGREYQISALRVTGLMIKIMSYFVYVLRSVNFERNYTGFCRDVELRLSEHNDGKTKSTKGYRPWKLIYTEEMETKEEALEREKYLKSGIGRDFIKKMTQDPPICGYGLTE